MKNNSGILALIPSKVCFAIDFNAIVILPIVQLSKTPLKFLWVTLDLTVNSPRLLHIHNPCL